MSDSKISVPTLSETLAKFPCLKLQTNNKILCSVTGHEMSARADVVYSYITGKKFKKDSEWYLYDFSEFLPYIVPDKVDAKKYMRCKITDQRLNRIPQEIKNHMSGKKFQRCDRR
jgi:wyosine [tRNA(Phe)-imidazoG37] synthetase (radical SAM superfamily)